MSKFNIFVILLIGFVDYLGIGLVYPVFAVMLFDPHRSIMSPEASAAYRGTILGILIALTPLTQFFFSPILGTFSDIKGRKLALIVGIAIGSVGYLLAVLGIWYSSLTLLFLYRILVGVSDSTAAVAQATIADISTEKNKARLFAFLNSSLGLGFTVGPFIGGKLADYHLASWTGYPTPFIFAGILCTINLILVLWHFPETHRPAAKTTYSFSEGIDNLKKIFAWKGLKWLFVAGFAIAFGWSFFNEFIPVLLRERFDFSTGDMGNFYAWSGDWYAIGAALATATLVKYFQPESLVTKAAFGTAVCMLLFIPIYNTMYIWIVLPFLMWCLAIVYPAATAIVSNHTSSENQGEVLGIYQAVQAFAMGLSPLVVGGAVGIYPSLSVWGGAASMIVAGIAFWISNKKDNTKI